MSGIAEYTNTLDDLVPGEHPLDETLLENKKIRAVMRAMAVHSKHKPRIVVEDIPADGGNEYSAAQLSHWDPGFSGVLRIDYPAGNGYSPLIEGKGWTLLETPAGTQIRFLECIPKTGENFRVTYTAIHDCTPTDCTVAAADETAVFSLAAGYYCKILATAYALDQDGTITADALDHEGRTRKYSDLAKVFLEEYRQHMGIYDNRPRPSCRIQDQDVAYPFGDDRLTHPMDHR